MFMFLQLKTLCFLYISWDINQTKPWLRLGTEESSCQKYKKLCQTADLKPKQVHIEENIEIETQIYPGHFNKNQLKTC
jgi:hypothetical protein